MELIAEDICFGYKDSRKILNNVNFSIKSGEIVGLVGDSGSGKSTLCKILSGYIKNYSGKVYLDYKEVNNKGFNPIQLIYQHPEKVMNPKWKMKDILEESYDFDDSLLKQFGIHKSWLNRWPNELSGGELQRFSVLRSLNPKTKFLIADEMTTMLDAVTQVQLFTSVINIVKDRNIGFLIVSHDKPLLDRLCDKIIHLDDINNI